MPLDAEKVDELKSNIAFARKRPLAFGLCLGKSPETTVLLNHKTKDPETVGRQAKKEGETAKLAFGMMSVEGKNLDLSCHGEPVPGLARKAKEMLKAVGLKMKVRILDAEGNLLEEDGDEDEEEGGPTVAAAAPATPTPATPTSATVPPPDPQKEKWAQTRPRVGEAMGKASADGKADLTSAQATWAAAEAAAAAGDFGRAMQGAADTVKQITAAIEAGRAVEADRARWLAAADKLRPIIDGMGGAGTPEAKKIAAFWSFAQSKTEGPKPDFATALKTVGMLAKLIAEMRAKGAEGAAPGVAPAADTVAADGDDATPAAAPVIGTPGGVPGGAPGGTPPADAAPTGPVAGPAADAAPAPAPAPAPDVAPDMAEAPGGGKAAAPDVKGTPDEKLKRAEDQLKAIGVLVAAYDGLIPGSAEPSPPAWAAETARITGILAAEKAKGAAADVTVLDKALEDLAKFEADVRAKSAAKAAWKKELDLFNLRLVPLDRHAQSGAVPQVKPTIDAIKADLAAAVAKADAQKFTEAVAAVKALYARCDTAETLADGYAHYATILAQRQALVAPIAGAATGTAEIDTLIAKCNDLLAKAQADATAGKFPDAVKKLDEIVPTELKLQQIFVARNQYNGAVANLDPRLAAIKALPVAVRDQVKDELADFEKIYTDAKYAKTNDYVVSNGRISGLSGHMTFLENTTGDVAAYAAALTTFEAQFALFKAHKGRPGIEEFYLGMENDLAQAKADAGSMKHATALALLNRTQPRWAAEQKNADDCLAYTDKRALVAKAIDDQRARAGAAPAVAQADQLMAQAANNATAKAFTTALANVTEAEKRAAEAKAAADAAGDLGKLKDGAALDGMAADFAKAWKVWTDMRANVAGKDAGGTMAALFTPADGKAKLAQDEAAKGAAADFGAARANLDAAIALLDGILAKFLAKAPYDAHLAEVKGLVTGPLTALNLDDCLKTAIAAINTLVAEAEALAKTPGFDFAGAEAKITEARGQAQKAQANGGLWPAIKANRAVAVNAKGLIAAEPTVVPHMAARTARLDKLIGEIDTAKTAGDFATADAKGREAAGLLAPTTTDIATCKQAMKQFTDWYTNRVAAITGPGKEAAAAKLAIVNTKVADYNTLMAGGNFEGAANLTNAIYWDIEDGKNAIAEKATYETARTAAEAKLNAARAVRNAGIEKELKPLEDRYAAAAATAATGVFRTPEAEMKAIAPLCDPLVAKAAAWKLYEDAKAPARAKLDAAKVHAMAAAMQPVIERMEAQFAKAETTATGGDPAGGKTLMEAIGPALDEATKTADASAKFAADARGGAGSDMTKAPDPAEIKKIEDMIKALRARPEAPAADRELKEAERLIGEAQVSGGDPAANRAKLQEAAEAAIAAETVLGQHKTLVQAADMAKAALAALKGHAQKDFIAADIPGLEGLVDAAVKASLAGTGPDMAAKNLAFAQGEIDKLRAVADAQAAYLAERAKPGVEPQLEVLEKHAHRYAIKDSIDKIRSKLQGAADAAAGRKHADAMTLLAEVRDLGASALMLADMRANKPPSAADVKALLARPGGDKELDAMIAQLEPDAQRAVMRVAFEAKFGCQLQNFNNPAMAPGNLVADGTQTGPNIKRFYEEMAKLPPADTRGNDSLKLFNNVEAGPGGSSYNGTDKKIVMNEGDARFSGAYRFGLEHETGKVEPDCEPANKDPVSFFSWNTLHEVGHAVDDKHGFMNKNQSGADYGGWTMYGRNVQPIAAKIAAKFKYDTTYVGQYMERNNNPAIPELPAGTDAEEWESRRVAVRAFVDAAKVSNNPWSSAGIAARLVIDTVVYQESYDNRWSSYSHAARAQAITGYQFRAPGEWFAELYAAYHSKKLKPTHPAAKWLATL